MAGPLDASGDEVRAELTGRSLQGDAAILFAGKVGSNLAQAALAIMTARALGPSGRGAIVLVLTVVTVMTLLSSVGTSVVMRTRLAAGQRSDIPSFLGLACVLLGSGAALTGLVAATALSLTDVGLDAADVVIIAAFGGASVAVWLLLDVLHGLGRHRIVAIIDLLGSASQLFLYVGGAAVFGHTVRIALAAILAGYALEALLLLRALGLNVRPTSELARWRSLLRDGVLPLRQSLAELAVFRTDRLVLGFTRSTEEVGLYSIAAATAELLRLFPTALGQVVAPRIAAASLSLGRVVRIRFVALALMASAAFLLTAFGSRLIPALAGGGFRAAVPLLGLMVLGETLLASYLIDSNVMLAQGHYRRASAAASVCGPLVLAINIGVIPTFGARGAAWATVAGYAGMALIARRMLLQGSTDSGTTTPA